MSEEMCWNCEEEPQHWNWDKFCCDTCMIEYEEENDTEDMGDVQ